MPTPGPWQSDSVPQWITLNSLTSATPTTHWLSEGLGSDYATAADAAWAATSGSSITRPTYYPEISFPNAGLCDWWQLWYTVTRGSTAAEEGLLPASVYTGGAFVDPNVIGVEWEPTETLLDQQATVTLGTGSVSPISVAGTPVTIKTRDDGTSFLTRTAMVALDTLATLTPATTNDTPSATFDPAVSLSGGSLTFGVLDSWTLTGTTPDDSLIQPRQRHPFTFEWQGLFAPRYRLLYADTAPVDLIPPLRQWPRSDGLGLSTARRVTGSRTVQGSLRRAGGTTR